MKKHSEKTFTIILSALLVLSAFIVSGCNSTYAMNKSTMGNRHKEMPMNPMYKEMQGHGYYMDSYKLDYNYMAENFSKEDITKIENERDKFLTSTENIRKDIYTKHHDLRRELSNENPDINKTWELREAISKLKIGFDKKRFDCINAMKRINPKAVSAFMGKGYSKMQHKCKCKMRMGGM